MEANKKLNLAVRFIWATFAVLILGYVIALFLPVPQSLENEAAAAQLSLMQFVLIKIVGLTIIWGGLIYWLTSQIRARKEWARVIFILLLILQLLSSLNSLYLHVGNSSITIATLSALLNGLHIIFDISAIYLLLRLNKSAA